MVKPSRTMQPEAVNLEKAGRRSGAAFQEDSFVNYMARKIDLQRQQFGVQLPPTPQQSQQEENQQEEDNSSKPTAALNSPKQSSSVVRFDPTLPDDEEPQTKKRKRKKKKKLLSKNTIPGIIQRLQQRHGKGHAHARRKRSHRELLAASSPMFTFDDEEEEDEGEETVETEIRGGNLKSPEPEPKQLKLDYETQISSPQPEARSEEIQMGASPPSLDYSEEEPQKSAPPPSETSSPAPSKVIVKRKSDRPDLFFLGVVIKVTGYTDPCNETLKRMIQKHGGDLETYETTRVTHRIAESMSHANALRYKQQKSPVPVVTPKWIVDSVAAGKLLPYGDYILECCRTMDVGVASYFGKKTTASTEVGASPNKDHPSLLKADNTIKNPFEDLENTASQRKEGSPMKSSEQGKTDSKYINGKIRTTGTDPNFLESFFNNSRLSFIGSYRQRTKANSSPSKVANKQDKDTQQFVFHVDMDCFFANVALRKFPHLREKPVVISHHAQPGEGGVNVANNRTISDHSSSECATCNYKAREYGIKKGMFLGRAKQLCPELVVLCYDFEGYEEVSEKVLEILERIVGDYDGSLEPVSCDEAYMALMLPKSGEEAGQLANQIRAEILEATECTASIGVGANKFLAKLGTDRVKPNGSYVVRDARLLLEPLRLRDLHGIGYRSEPKLVEEGLETVRDVWDLGDQAEGKLCRILGPGLGKKILMYCQGKDDREVKPAQRKTIGAECNYGVRFDGPYGVDYLITGLAKEVQKRMVLIGVKGSKITLKVKQRKHGAKPPPKFLGHGSCHNISKSMDTPGSVKTRDYKIFSELGMVLFKEMGVALDDVRGMGIVISKLDNEHSGENETDQSNAITKWFQKESPKKPPATDKAVDQNQESEAFEREHTDQLPHAEGHLPNDDDDDDLSISSEALLARNSDRSRELQQAMPTGTPENFGDIDLPSLSQIHMSQVKELPEDLQSEIMGRINAKREGENNDVIVLESDEDDDPLDRKPAAQLPQASRTSFGQEEVRFRQSSLKRMMELAAVKAGQKDIGVSMTQYESLDLETKLQLANGDTCGVGTLQKSKPKRRSNGNIGNKQLHLKPAPKYSRKEPPSGKSRKSPTKPLLRETNNNDLAHDIIGRDSSGNEPDSVETIVLDGSGDDADDDILRPDTRKHVEPIPIRNSREFYTDNVVPLSVFLSSNSPSTESIGQVVQLLSMFVAESRDKDMLVLIRCIRNRQDEWPRQLKEIVRQLDVQYFDSRGFHLDLDWLLEEAM